MFYLNYVVKYVGSSASRQILLDTLSTRIPIRDNVVLLEIRVISSTKCSYSHTFAEHLTTLGSCILARDWIDTNYKLANFILIQA